MYGLTEEEIRIVEGAQVAHLGPIAAAVVAASLFGAGVPLAAPLYLGSGVGLWSQHCKVARCWCLQSQEARLKKILLATAILLAARLSHAEGADMKNVLIVYGSYAGSTAEIADSMKAALGRAGSRAYVIPASGLAVDLSPCDLVVIGSAMHGARPHEKVGEFIAVNRAGLDRKKVAVFAACITMTSVKEDKRKAAQAYPGLVAHGLSPVSTAVFAGKAPPSGWFGNLMGKLMLGITPGDYRDWKKIEEWAVSLPGLAL